MCTLRFENNLLIIEDVRFASISKKTPLSKLSFAFVSLALPLLVTRFFALGFYLESSYLKPLKITVGSIKFFVKIHGNIASQGAQLVNFP
jgi:hypothetical protein